MTDLSTIQAALKQTLSRRRYDHSVAVANLAAALAKSQRLSPEELFRAGLIHDCAKEWSPARLKSYVRRERIPVPDFDFIAKNNPNLLHAYVGAHFSSQKGWIGPRARRAVASHTLGRVGMTTMEKILYVADFSSKDRAYGSARKVRRLAMRDLNAAFRLALYKKIKWNLTASKPVHPLTLRVWNSLFI